MSFEVWLFAVKKFAQNYDVALLIFNNLPDSEKERLRQEYVDSVRNNLRNQLDNINIQEADGSITNLGKKFGKKK